MTTVAGTQASFCAVLTDEWRRSGVREAVVCPGSRSTPMAVALSRCAGIRVHVRLDERGAGFYAIGLALAYGGPVVVLTTSGTAAAELHAAVVEAHHSRLPLIVCTADRPPELQNVGAPQTIDQRHLYGAATRYFIDAGVPEEVGRPFWRSLASRLAAEATGGPAGCGPVHLNLPFREPLLGEAGALPPGRERGLPYHDVVAVEARVEGVGADSKELFARDRRGIVVVGGGCDAGAATELARRLAWPLVADPRSGARSCAGAGGGATVSPAGTGSDGVIGAADAVLRVAAFAEAAMPEVVVRAGEPWASRILAEWLSATAAAGAVHIGFDPQWGWRDPGREMSRIVRAPLDAGVVEALAPACEAASQSDWLGLWSEAESAAQEAIDEVIRGWGGVSEPGLARTLYGWAPAGSVVFASSSMPVRELEWFGRPRDGAPPVLSNRGANGIDGVISTILGLAAGMAADKQQLEAPVYGLVGDLAVLHDASALVRPARGAPPTAAVVVVADNRGGGIFSFLPQARELDGAEFEQLFGTPQDPPVADLVRGCGYEVSEVTESAEMVPALEHATAVSLRQETPVFVVARTDREANVEIHRVISEAVSNAVGASLADRRAR